MAKIGRLARARLMAVGTGLMAVGISLVAVSLGAPRAYSAPKAKEKPSPPVPLVDRSTYIHHWQAMPKFTARQLPGLSKVKVEPIQGRIQVLVFLASWNVTSLRIAPKLAKFSRRYSSRGVDFIYAFSHDQLADIRGFLKEFPLEGLKVLADRALIAAHMEPKIPTLLISDKHGWLTYRTSGFSRATFAEVDQLLGALSGL